MALLQRSIRRQRQKPRPQRQLTGRNKPCKNLQIDRGGVASPRQDMGGRRMARTSRRWGRLSGAASALALLIAGFSAPALSASASEGDFRQRPPQDEVIYFLLPDRFANGDPSNDHGGYAADRLVSGFDPANPEFYHGGDLAGIIQKLDYIQGLGATAIWMAPVFKNKPVQPTVGRPMAGFHGYWITDFTRPDPHFG